MGAVKPPFIDLNKRIKSKAKVQGVVLLDEADNNWEKLPQSHHLPWHLLRWSGAHASEVGSLRWEDIDLHGEEVIHFTSHETRPLKNAFRVRTIPFTQGSCRSSRKRCSMNLARC